MRPVTKDEATGILQGRGTGEDSRQDTAHLVEFSAQDLHLIALALRTIPAAFETWEFSIVIGIGAEESLALAAQLDAIAQAHWKDATWKGWSTERVRASHVTWERWNEHDDDSLAQWFSIEHDLLTKFSTAVMHAAHPEPALMTPLPAIDALDKAVILLLAERLRLLLRDS